ncbi:hypothetical protein SNOG_10945 [Parastagonospora nodorum SN15]|uniref:Uncharacterized protein n=1 Tax=Phaeosphaeria nodorum (strain SN15 / ATCC MYA-4574 / FGSC 10173) TaxID=321614 RepID=Q0UBB9_PHANO|nr:hypothetical protein SNOG_10945 [Parastagonospora nodorum SN15]EAT81444.1 hypothetical protein SNOG_10945 [Parastagonospora nodorum SN15]
MSIADSQMLELPLSRSIESKECEHETVAIDGCTVTMASMEYSPRTQVVASAMGAKDRMSGIALG